MVYYPQPMNNLGGGQMSPPSSSMPLGYGGYYSGQYTAFNPYEIQRRQQEMQRQQHEIIKNQQDITAKIYMASCKGREPEQRVLDNIYGISESQKRIPGFNNAQQAQYEHLANREELLHSNNMYIDQLCSGAKVGVDQQAQLMRLEQMHKEREKELPQDMGVFEYFASVAQDDLRKAEENRVKQQQANLTALYNQNAYNQFLNKFRMPGQQTMFNPNASTDDMAITLPQMCSEEERRQRRLLFLKNIGLS